MINLILLVILEKLYTVGDEIIFCPSCGACVGAKATLHPYSFFKLLYYSSVLTQVFMTHTHKYSTILESRGRYACMYLI